MTGSIAERFNASSPFMSAKEPLPPVAVSATPYTWRDPTAIPRRPWIFGHQIMRGQVGGKFAPGAAGKTTHEVGVCLSLSTGRPFLGPQVWGGPKRAWLWNLEDNGDELARIIQATAKHWRITEADVDGRLFVDSALEGATLKLATQTSMNGVVINEPLVEALIEELRARQIDYLSVDPFISSHAVEENDNGAIDAVVKKWAFVAQAAGCAIGLTHHVRKSNNGEVSSESARGASSLVAACRSALVLNRMSSQEATGWSIGEEERRRYFRVYDDKNNRAPPADKSNWYHLVSVDLGNGGMDGLMPGDSVGVAVPWTPPDALEDVKVEHVTRVQELVDERGNVRANVQSPRWVGKIIGEVVGLDPADPAERKKINTIQRTWINNGALIETERPDKNGDPRKFIEVGTWTIASGRTSSPAPQNQQVRTSAEGAGSGAGPAPAPPIYRGAVVRDPAGDNQGAGAEDVRAATRGVLPGMTDGPVLAPGESADDPVPGWDRTPRF